MKLLTREVFLWKYMNEMLAQSVDDTTQGRDWTVETYISAQSLSMRVDQLNDDEDDPAKKACPSGACPTDKKLYRDIYEDSIKKVAKINNFDLNDPRERSMAHREILPLFRQRVRADRKSLPQDREGPPTAEGPEFTMLGGRIFYIEFQKFMQDMFEDQKRIRPKEYDSRIHATMTLIEKALNKGATEVSHISHNTDDQGNEAIRDEITMVFDAETGKGKMEIRNIATEGHFLDSKEAYDKMKRSHPDRFIEGHPTEGVFIFSDVPMESKDVHEVLSRHGATNISDSIMLSEQTWDVNDNENITIKPDYVSTSQSPVLGYVEDYLTHGVDRFLTYVHDKYEETVVPAFMRKLLDLPIREDEKEIFVSIRDTLKISQLTVSPLINEQNEDSNALTTIWLSRAEELLHITPEQSEKLLMEVQETWTMMQDAKEVISFVNESKVGIGIAVLAIHELASIGEPAEPADELFETWTTMQDAKEVISFTADMKIAIGAGVSVLQIMAAEESIEIMMTEKIILTEEEYEAVFSEQIPDSVDTVALKETVEFIRAIDALPVEDQEQAIITEKEKIEEKIIYLWEVITKPEPAVATIHALTEIVDLEPKDEHEKQFSFAFAVWIMLKLMNYHSALETLEAFVKPDQDSPLETRIQKQKPEGLIQKETGQWLLFAIIWYLAMIRESSGAGSRSAGQPKRKKKKKAEEVLIFAYTS